MVSVAFEQPTVLRASINCRIRMIFQKIAHFVTENRSVSVEIDQDSVTEEILHMARRCI